MIGLMMVLLTFLWIGECSFSTVGVGVVLGNWSEIQGENYAALL